MSPITSITRKLTLNSIKDCTKSMGELLAAQLEIERLTAKRDAKVQEVCGALEVEIRIARRNATKHEEALTSYYEAHAKELELETGKKSYQLPNGEIGRRLGGKKLSTFGKWTWETALEKLQSLWPGEYILPPAPPEVNKTLVKAKLKPEELKLCGLEIVQEDSFYANPARPPDPDKVAA